MKRSKRLGILTGVLVVVSALTFAIFQYQEQKEQISNSEEVILSINSEDVTSLSWEYEDTSLSFHKDDTWIYDEDEAFPVDEDKINELLSIFENFSASFIIENVDDYAQYGLEDPTCIIHVEDGEHSYQITLGNYSTMDSKRYISIDDGNVYLVSNDPLNTYGIELNAMIKNDEIPSFSNTDISSIQFNGEENYRITYEEDSIYTYCDDDVYFTDIDGTPQPLDTSNITTYLGIMSNMTLSDYVTYHATDEDLQTYGLDDPDLSVEITYLPENSENEETFVLHVAHADEEDIAGYLQIGNSTIIYPLTDTQYKNLTAVSYDELRHQEVMSADFDDITQIDISLEDTEYTIYVDDETYYYNDEEIDINDFKNALKALTADSFSNEDATQKVEIALTLHLNNENHPEVSIVLYRYDGNYCLAEVEGESVSLVERSYVVDLIESVNAIVLNE